MRKYLGNGEEVEFIQNLENGSCLVYRLFVLEAGEETVVDKLLIIVPRVFDSPPVALIDKQIEEKNAVLQEVADKLQEARRKINDLDREYNIAKASHEKRMEKYKGYEALKHLDNFIEGKITHYLIHGCYGIDNAKIVSKVEYLDNYEHRKLRLLSLHGDSKGDLEWRLGYYSDASGSSERCFPFCSMEEAKEFLQKLINEATANIDKGNLSICRVADAYNLSVPQAYRDSALQAQKNSLLKNADEYKEKYEKSLQELNKFEVKFEVEKD